MLDTLFPCRRSVPADGWASDYHNRPQTKPRTQVGPLTEAQISELRQLPVYRELEAKMSAMRAPPRMVRGDLYAEVEEVKAHAADVAQRIEANKS